MKKKNKVLTGKILYYIGIGIVIATHLYLLSLDTRMTVAEMFIHSWINLFAAIMILLGGFLHGKN